MTATYDVAAFQTDITSTAEVPQELWELTRGRGLLVTGIVKLCQKFLLELLTVVGSMPFAETRGSSLLTFVREGRIRSDIDAHVYFQYAVREVEQQLIAAELDTDPDDSRFQSAEIINVTFTAEAIVYRVALTSRAGTSRTVSVPLTTLP